MSDLWIEASASAAEEVRGRLLIQARAALGDLVALTARCATRTDLENRLALHEERIDKVLQSIASGADFAVLHEDLVASLREDYDLAERARHAAEQKANAPRMAARHTASMLRCQNCGNEFEINDGEGRAPQVRTCPKCGSNATGEKTSSRKVAVEWQMGTRRYDTYPGLAEDLLQWEAQEGDYTLVVVHHGLIGYAWEIQGYAGNVIAHGTAQDEETAKAAAESWIGVNMGQQLMFASKTAADDDLDDEDIPCKHGNDPEKCPDPSCHKNPAAAELREQERFYSSKKVAYNWGMPLVGEPRSTEMVRGLGGKIMVQGFIDAEGSGNKWWIEVWPKPQYAHLETSGTAMSASDAMSQCDRAISAAISGTTASKVAWIEQARQVDESKGYQEVDGSVLDIVTANLLVKVYDGLNDANKAKFAALPLTKAVDVAWKLVKPASKAASYDDGYERGKRDRESGNDAQGVGFGKPGEEQTDDERGYWDGYGLKPKASSWWDRYAMRKGAPFAGYDDFEDCVSQNGDKDDPDAYCGKIKHEVEDKKTSKKARFECQECEHSFSHRITASTRDVGCPKCGSVDTLPFAYLGKEAAYEEFQSLPVEELERRWEAAKASGDYGTAWAIARVIEDMGKEYVLGARRMMAAFDAWVRCPRCGLEKKVSVPDDRPEDAGTTFYCPNDGDRMTGILESERKQSSRKVVAVGGWGPGSHWYGLRGNHLLGVFADPDAATEAGADRCLNGTAWDFDGFTFTQKEVEYEGDEPKRVGPIDNPTRSFSSLQRQAEFPPPKKADDKKEAEPAPETEAPEESETNEEQDTNAPPNGLEPDAMSPGQQVGIHYTLTGDASGEGDTTATFESFDQATGQAIFSYENGRFAATKGPGGSWIDAAGTQFMFSPNADPNAQPQGAPDAPPPPVDGGDATDDEENKKKPPFGKGSSKAASSGDDGHWVTTGFPKEGQWYQVHTGTGHQRIISPDGKVLWQSHKRANAFTDDNPFMGGGAGGDSRPVTTKPRQLPGGGSDAPEMLPQDPAMQAPAVQPVQVQPVVQGFTGV